MTTPRPKSTLQDELLADLRVAAPIPVTPPKPEAPEAESPAPPAPSADQTPTVSLRLTPWRWSRPSVDNVTGERTTLKLSAGPLQLSLNGFGRRHR